MKKAISKKSATTPSSRGTVVMARLKQTPAKTPKSAIYRCGECLHCRKPKWKKRCLTPPPPIRRCGEGLTTRCLTLTDKNAPSKESAKSNEPETLELAARQAEGDERGFRASREDLICLGHIEVGEEGQCVYYSYNSTPELTPRKEALLASPWSPLEPASPLPPPRALPASHRGGEAKKRRRGPPAGAPCRGYRVL